MPFISGELLWSQLDHETQVHWAAEIDQLARDCIQSARPTEDRTQDSKAVLNCPPRSLTRLSPQALPPGHLVGDLIADEPAGMISTPKMPTYNHSVAGSRRSIAAHGAISDSENCMDPVDTPQSRSMGAFTSPGTPASVDIASPVIHTPLHQYYRLPRIPVTKSCIPGQAGDSHTHPLLNELVQHPSSHQPCHQRPPHQSPSELRPATQQSRSESQRSTMTRQEPIASAEHIRQSAQPQFRTPNDDGNYEESYLAPLPQQTPMGLTQQQSLPAKSPKAQHIPQIPQMKSRPAVPDQCHPQQQLHDRRNRAAWHSPASSMDPAARPPLRRLTAKDPTNGTALQAALPIQQYPADPQNSPQLSSQPPGSDQSEDPDTRDGFKQIMAHRAQNEAQWREVGRVRESGTSYPAHTNVHPSKKRTITVVDTPTTSPSPAKMLRMEPPALVNPCRPGTVCSPSHAPVPLGAHVASQSAQDCLPPISALETVRSLPTPDRHPKNPSMERLDKWCKRSRIYGLFKGEEWAHTWGNPRAQKPHYHFGKHAGRCTGCRQLGIRNLQVLQTIHDRFQGSGGL